MFNNQSFGFGPDTRHEHGFRNGCGPMGFRPGNHHWMKQRIMEKLERHFGSKVPVNIEETDEFFALTVYAAGLQKEHIKVVVKDDMLMISYKGATGNEDNQQFTHREHQPASFERSFQLNGKVLTNEISAAYAEGILKVILPKDPATNQPAQHVNVG